MLACIACSKHLTTPPLPDDDVISGTPSTRHAIKSLTAQIKDMAMKASGAYRHCSKPCAGSDPARHRPNFPDSGRVGFEYRRAGDNSEIEGGDGILEEVSIKEEAEKLKEWVAQVEPGVLITFVSVAEGGNDLKRIRFSREMFDKWQAQKWWAENYDKVMELYNVQKFNCHAFPPPKPPLAEAEMSKMELADGSPKMPPPTIEQHPQPVSYRNIRLNGPDGHHYHEPGGQASTPKLSSISGVKTETSSVDAASVRTSSEADRSGEVSVSAVSNASETEWVEQDEPGVYITIRVLPGGIRELRRVRFSRERFGEMHARLWWEENRARIHEQYL